MEAALTFPAHTSGPSDQSLGRKIAALCQRTWARCTVLALFGFAVHFGAAGAASGQFNCLMAGASAFPGFEPLMKVSGSVTGGSLTAAAGTASFTGSGTLNLGPNGRMPAVFQVSIREGGPGVGKLHLIVLVPFFPVPEETVLNGQITIH